MESKKMTSTKGKRSRSTSTLDVKKDGKPIISLEDSISNLPDEILVSILSLLTTNEAVRTSVLSRRWKNLWTFTSKLNFGRPALKSLEYEQLEFVAWVSRVLQSYKGETLDEFSVTFDVGGERYKHEIDSWIIFALAKNVKRLELNLARVHGFSRYRNYTLTPLVLDCSTVDSLTALEFSYVNVNEEVLLYFLSKCPFLEVLKVSYSMSLDAFKVSGSSLRLRHLELSLCFNLEHIEISAPKLVSFKYRGPESTRILIKDTPSLVEVSYQGHYACFLAKNPPQYPCYFSQLEKLKLDLSSEKFRSLPELPTFRNLKHLDLMLDASGSNDLLFAMSLLEAAPVLHILELRLVCINASQQGTPRVRKAKNLHLYLKAFELAGFVGCRVDMELILYILEHAVALEKLVIDPRSSFAKSGMDFRDTEVTQAARKSAKMLKPRLPQKVDLVIL